MLKISLSTLRNSLMAQSVATMIFMVVALLVMGSFAYLSNRNVANQANQILYNRLPVSINSLEMLDELNDIQLSLYSFAQGDISAKSSFFKNSVEFHSYREKLGIEDNDQESGIVNDKSGHTEIENSFDHVMLIDKLMNSLQRDVVKEIFSAFDPLMEKEKQTQAKYLLREIKRDIIEPLLQDEDLITDNSRFLETLNAAIALQQSIDAVTPDSRDVYFRSLQNIQTNSTIYCLSNLSLDCEYFTHKLRELSSLGELYFAVDFAVSQADIIERLDAYDEVYFSPIQQTLETLSTKSNILIRDEIKILEKRLFYLSFAIYFATFACLALILLLFILIARKMLRPFEIVSHILTQLRKNEYYVKVPRLKRDNEVGRIYAGLRTLRNSLRELEELRKKEFNDEKMLHNQQMTEAYEALKKSESNLRDYSKQLETSNQDLEQFIHIASHDLREPLKNIMGTVQMIRLSLNDIDPKIANNLEKIGTSVTRMEQLTNDMRALARMQNVTEEPQNCNIPSLVDEGIANNKNHLDGRFLSLDIQPLPEIVGYRDYLRIVFDQLIANAIQYGAQKLLIKLYAQEAADFVEIIFENNLDETLDISQDLLLPFKRGSNANVESSGVGLTVCRKIIDGLHKGEIVIQKGNSKTFSVLLRFPKYA